MKRALIEPPLRSTFDEVYEALSSRNDRQSPTLKTTGGVDFVAHASVAKDGRKFIELPHSNRVYEEDWGLSTNGMGEDGQRIAHYTIPLADWVMAPNYWVVGAMWGGSEDVLDTFITRGYWYCWDIGEASTAESDVGNSVSAQRERFLQIKSGDRIAVKKMLGRGSTEIELRALGIVKEVDSKEWRAYVNWITDGSFSRRVPIKGCAASVHGPFNFSDPWTREVFCI